MEGQVLIKNATVLTFGQKGRVIENGALLFSPEKIIAVGSGEEVVPQAVPGAEEVDARGAVVTPGLVNAHMHLYSTLACGISPAPSKNFVEILKNLWWRLDKALTLDDVRISAMVAASRCLKAGVTTIIDHHASFGAIRGSLRAIAEVAKEVCLRACLAYEVSDRHGEAQAEEAIGENVAFIEELLAHPHPDLAALFGLHASFTLSDRTLKKCAQAARGVGFHVHVAEDLADAEDARRRGFDGVVSRLEAFGILGPRTIAAHSIHVSQEEMAKLAQTGTIVVTNPQSNMNNAVGVCDVPSLLKAGCIVGLGSDGMTADILQEVRAAILTARQHRRDPQVMFTEAVDMLCVTNPKVATSLFGRPIGVLEPEAVPDVVIWDYVPPTPINEANMAGHIVFGLASSRPSTVFSCGRKVVADGKVITVDEVAVAREAKSLAASLWSRW